MQYRSSGAIEAAKLGAVASLVRSVTDFSISSPHTGTMSYSDHVTKIPSAAIAVEDATMLYRLYKSGQFVMKSFHLIIYFVLVQEIYHTYY